MSHYFDQLHHQVEAIQAEFGGPLRWDPLEGYRTSIIRWDNPQAGGFRDDPDSWPEVGDDIADAMSRLVEATKGRVASLGLYEVVELEAAVEASASASGDISIE